MSDVYIYDKAKYHNEFIFEHGLGEEHAANHAVPILRWFIENNLMCEKFISSSLKEISEFRSGKMTIHELYFRLGNCLTSAMFSKRGNEFAMYYFDYQKGNYIKDYRTTLQGSLPTELHVSYSDDNYQQLRPLIDSAYNRWSAAKSWWKIWK